MPLVKSSLCNQLLSFHSFRLILIQKKNEYKYSKGFFQRTCKKQLHSLQIGIIISTSEDDNSKGGI